MADSDGNGVIDAAEFRNWWSGFLDALSPTDAYNVLVASGQVRDDPAQRAALLVLQRVWDDLPAAPEPPPKADGGGG
eukprot:gene46426-893_t